MFLFQSEGGRLDSQWQLRQGWYRVDAAGTQKYETGTRIAAIFQQIDGAEQIMLEQLP